MTALRTLHLYGDLGDRFGREHRVAAATIGDAIRVVDCNEQGFALAMRRRKFHVAHGDGRISYGSTRIALGQSKAQEVQPHQYAVPRASGDWHLVPALEGSKGRGFKTVFSIVVGGALLATGIGGALGAFGQIAANGAGAAGSLGAGLATSTGFLGLSYGTVALMGASMFLGGINMLLAPTPKADTADRKPTAFGFDGPSETDDEGGPIPIIIGEVLTGPVRAASAITTAGQVNNSRGKNGGKGGTAGKFAFAIAERVSADY